MPEPDNNSEWTTANLLEFVQQVLVERERELDERTDRWKQQFADKDTRDQQRYEAMQRAIDKAEAASEKRLDAVNEFRAQLKDQQTTLITRAEAEARFTAISDTLADLKERVTRNEGRAAGAAAFWGIIVGAGGLLIAAILLVRDFAR